MKKIIIFSVCIVVCFLSCTEKPSPRHVSISVVRADTNYHPCDSIQRLAGYYPARVYLLLAVYNMSNETLFLPIQGQYDTLTKSSIEFIGDISGRSFLCESETIPPKDTIGIALVVNMDEMPDSEVFRVLHNFMRDLNMSYRAVASDTLLSKYPMPDSVIFNIDRNIELNFLDIEDLEVESDWI